MALMKNKGTDGNCTSGKMISEEFLEKLIAY